jgi:flagellar motor protein MotB
MFARLPPRPEEEQKDIFAPVSDLMVGVVFIFIILILALSLDLSTEKTVPRSTYDLVVEQNRVLTQQLADTSSKLEQATSDLRSERARRTAAEAQVADLSSKLGRLVDFVRFVRDSQIAPLMERLSKADQTRASILNDMKSRLSALGVNVEVNSDAGTLNLPSTKLFASAQADPTIPDGRDTILRLGQVMADVLPCYAPTAAGAPVASSCPAKGDFSNLSAVYIEGHTDVFPFASATGRFRNNWDLSAGRAIEAFTLIRDHYQSLQTLRNQEGEAVLGVSGYADTRPMNRSATDRQVQAEAERDRRIEVRVIMSTNEQLVGAVLNELNLRLRSVDELVH